MIVVRSYVLTRDVANFAQTSTCDSKFCKPSTALSKLRTTSEDREPLIKAFFCLLLAVGPHRKVVRPAPGLASPRSKAHRSGRTRELGCRYALHAVVLWIDLHGSQYEFVSPVFFPNFHAKKKTINTKIIAIQSLGGPR